MRESNILVTGANGQLGCSIRRVIENRRERLYPSSFNYYFTDVDELDITDKEAVDDFIKKHDVNVVINCAAYTNVDKAEDDYEFAEKLNAEAVYNLAEAIKKKDGFLIHISTDYVFGGSSGNTPRNEKEEVNPTGVYGLTKLHGEEKIKLSGAKSIIIRTAWLYSEYGNNFVKTMLRLTSEKPVLKVVFDQCGTPTYARDLATTIIEIVETGKFKGNEGIYHYSNEGVCSWYDFTKFIAEIAGNNKCEVFPCHSNEFPSKVVRPNYSVLDKTKIKETFELKIPYWTDSLKKCISNLI